MALLDIHSPDLSSWRHSLVSSSEPCFVFFLPEWLFCFFEEDKINSSSPGFSLSMRLNTSITRLVNSLFTSAVSNSCNSCKPPPPGPKPRLVFSLHMNIGTKRKFGNSCINTSINAFFWNLFLILLLQDCKKSASKY